jgi:hypothetical protein
MPLTRIGLMPLAVLALAAAGARADGACRTFSGDFTAIPPEQCTSPVGICTHGTLTGGFPSTYDFVMDTLVPTRIPGVFAYTGHSLITTPSGATLTGSDSGLMRMNGDGTASFVTVVRVVSGTGELAGATGGIIAPGKLNLATGSTVGTYSGLLCRR